MGEGVAALQCQGLGIFSPQLDLEASSTRTWLLAPLLASPRAGLELAGLPAPLRVPEPQSYGRALHGPRLLSRVQLAQGLAGHHTPAAQDPQISVQPGSPTLPSGCLPQSSPTEEPWACIHLPVSSGGMWVIRGDVLLTGGAGYSWRFVYPLPLIP